MSEENKATEQADDRVYTLRRPIVFEEKEYTKLLLDFEALTGDDLLQAERRFSVDNPRTGDATMVKEFSKGYLTYIVAAAAKEPVELIKKLSAKDFSTVTLLAQNFLLL